MSFKKTSRDHSNSIDNSKNREHDSRNYKAEDQCKEDIIPDTELLEILEGVLHKKETDSLQQQNDAYQKANIDTVHSKINHPLLPPVLSFHRNRRRKQFVPLQRLRAQEAR